jgi:hypothetical protein
MNRFKKANPQKYQRLKRLWKLLLKDSDDLNSSNYRYDRSFKQFIADQAILNELLTYDERLRSAYETCQLLCCHFKQKNSRHFFELIDSLDPLLPTLPLRDRKCPASQLQQRSGRRNKQRDQSHEKICPHGYRNFLNFRVRIYRIQGLVFQDHSILHTEKTA